MNIDTNTIVPISVANQNFSKVARLVDQYGSAVIMKNNAPVYHLRIQPSGHHAGGSRRRCACFLREAHAAQHACI